MASPTVVNETLTGTVPANSQTVFTTSGYPTDTEVWSIAFRLSYPDYNGISIGTANTAGYYITPGSQLYVAGVQLNSGELSIAVENDTDQDIDALLIVGGLLI